MSTLSSKLSRFALLLIVSLSLLLSACTKSLPGGHSVTVNVPSNGCGTTACTQAPATPDILIVK